MANVRMVMTPGWELQLGRETLKYQRWLARQVGRDVRGNIRAGNHIVTAALLNSVEVRGTRVSIGTDHWPPIEYGARPHLIMVKHRKVMSDGVTIYGKVVNHPGNRAYRVMRRALYQKRTLVPLG